MDRQEGLTGDGVFIRRELFDVHMSQVSSGLTEVGIDVAKIERELREHEEAAIRRREGEASERRAFQRSLMLLVIGALFSSVLGLLIAVVRP